MIYFPFSLSMSHNFELGCVTVTFPHTLYTPPTPQDLTYNDPGFLVMNVTRHAACRIIHTGQGNQTHSNRLCL